MEDKQNITTINFDDYIKKINNEEKELFFNALEHEVTVNHEQNKIIGNFNGENIEINNIGVPNFKLTTTVFGQQQFKEEQIKDHLKYLILLIASYTNNVNKASVKKILSPNSNVNSDNVASFYFKVHDKINSDYVTKKIRYSEKTNKESQSNTNGYQKVLKNGNKQVIDNQDSQNIFTTKPNGFVSLFLFPALVIYVVIMIALVYWIMVLK